MRGIRLIAVGGVRLLLLHLIAFGSPLVAANCPEGCVCANKLIICTCQGGNREHPLLADGGRQNDSRTTTPPTAVTLGSFSGIDFVEKVYVHSCERLIVPENCFKGLAIGQQLNFKAIGELHIRPFAFRQMSMYPKKITFENTFLPRLSHDAFSGLVNVDILRFRNATVGTIKHKAFRSISQLKYVYFYQSQIEHIEHMAFGHMMDIRHVFFKGSTRIGTIADHAFAKSSIDEICFDSVFITNWHVFTMGGIVRVGAVRIINCSINKIDFDSGTHDFRPTADAALLEISKSNFSTLALTPYSNFREIKIDHCMDIQELVRVPGLHLRNVTLIKFRTSIIQHIRAEALRHSADITDVLFEESAVDTIEPYALADLHNVSYLIFMNTRFNIFKADAFRNSSFESVIVDGAQELQSLEPFAFRGLRAGLLRLSGSVITTIDAQAFEGATVRQLVVDGNSFGDVKPFAFHLAQVRDRTNITANTFDKRVAPQMLAGLVTTELNFERNKLRCSCDQMSLMLMWSVKPRTNYDSWRFADNKCNEEGEFAKSTSSVITACLKEDSKSLKPPTAVTAGRKVHQFGAMKCEEMAQRVDCACEENSGPIYLTGEVVTQLTANISFFSISHCESVRMARGAFSGDRPNLRFLSAVVLYKIGYLTLSTETFSRLANLRSVSIVNCGLPTVSPRAFHLLYGLRWLRLTERTFVSRLQHKAFSFSDIHHLAITGNVELDLISPLAFDQTRVHRLTVNGSRIKLIEVDAFAAATGRLARIDLNDAHIGQIRALDPKLQSDVAAGAVRVCIRRSRFDCDCGSDGALALLRVNRCSNSTAVNVCATPSEATGLDAMKHLARFDSEAMRKRCARQIPKPEPPSSNGRTATTGGWCNFVVSLTVMLLLLLVLDA